MKVSHKFFDIFHGIGTFEALGIAAIAAAGLTVLFGKKRNRIGNSRNRGFINHNGSFGNGGEPETQGYGYPNDDGDNVVIENGFDSINVFGNPSVDPEAPLIDADIDNGMGKVNIYFG